MNPMRQNFRSVLIPACLLILIALDHALASSPDPRGPGNITAINNPTPTASHPAIASSSDPPTSTDSATPTVDEPDAPAAPASNQLNLEIITRIKEIRVFPESIDLGHADDRQSFVVQALQQDGVSRDITDNVTVGIQDPSIAEIENGFIRPKSNGNTSLDVSLGETTISVPIEVSSVDEQKPVSFEMDVMPIFMKAGCNSGSCHGAARGKDGFRLSLYGFDPNGDYHRLTREQIGRRINVALPKECLLVEKATGSVPHSGGGPVEPQSEEYETLVTWLQAGAPADAGPVPSVTALELYPDSAVLEGKGASQRLTVRAIYSDGSTRDVTRLAYFMSSNDNSATVSQDGTVTSQNRGESFVMCRFDTHTVGIPVITLPANAEFTWPDIAETNYIDTLVHDKLRTLRIVPSDICSDREFIRRVSIDICGIVPTPEEVQAFVANDDPQKRSQLIDQLLNRKEFVEMWVMKWSELLQIRSSQQVSYKAALLYYNWLQEKVANDVPVDEMIRELLTAEGGTFTNPATNYYQNEQDNLKISENVAQVFLGMRLQCAQCHNHPFDRWTMDDYYSFAAFFAQIGRKRSEDPRETIVYNRFSGETKHPVTNQDMPPKFLGGDSPDTQGKDRRAVVAQWITSKDNPYFAKNLANIVWAHFFGRGIVHEVDDVRVSNPPSNAQLLDQLGRKFTEYDFDFKKLVRDICNSRTYQLSTQTNSTNESDLTNFSHAMLRRMRAEVLLDVISQVTETKNKFRGLPSGARAVQIADGNTSTYFLTTFGRTQRATVCSCEVSMEPNLSQALHLINGDTIHEKIKQGKVVPTLLDQGLEPMKVVAQLYLRCLGRQPNETELAAIQATLDEAEDNTQALEDVFWALLNSREFIFNH